MPLNTNEITRILGGPKDPRNEASVAQWEGALQNFLNEIKFLNSPVNINQLKGNIGFESALFRLVSAGAVPAKDLQSKMGMLLQTMVNANPHSSKETAEIKDFTQMMADALLKSKSNQLNTVKSKLNETQQVITLLETDNNKAKEKFALYHRNPSNPKNHKEANNHNEKNI